MRYAHTNLTTKDWKKLADFYINVFSCKPVPPQRDLSGDWLDKALGLKKAHLRGIHLRLPGHGNNGPTLEIYQYDEMLDNNDLISVVNRPGLGHLAFEVDDVYETLEKLQKNGGYKKGEIVVHQIKGVGELIFTYATDPDGNILEIQKWDRSKK